MIPVPRSEYFCLRTILSILTNHQDVLERLSSDDADLTDVNLNNVSGIEEKKICEIFDSLRKNNNLNRLSLVNCDVSNVIALILYTLERTNLNNSHHHKIIFNIKKSPVLRIKMEIFFLKLCQFDNPQPHVYIKER